MKSKRKSSFFFHVLGISFFPDTLVLGYPKAQGLESIPEDQVSLRVNQEFKDSGRYNECEDDYWIFRLSTKGRVIGKISNNIFYILAVDPKFDLYKH